jgi:hypothetical protein
MRSVSGTSRSSASAASVIGSVRDRTPVVRITVSASSSESGVEVR